MPAPEIRDTPPALVENGRIHSGFFKLPFRKVNLFDAIQMTGFEAKLLRRMRLKEWVGFGFDHPEVYGAMLIQNSGYAASGTVYLYEKETKRFLERLIIDFPWRATLPETLWDDKSYCKQGHQSLRFEHDLEHHQHRIHLEAAGSAGKPPLSADLVLHQDWRTTEPLVVSLPIAPQHHTYTHKSPLRMEGEIRVGETRYTFDPARDFGNLDEQKTFYPYRSHWKWGCFAGKSVEGRDIAVNFVHQMTPTDEPGEDALWVDGKLMLMPQPSIRFTGDLKDSPVEIGNENERLRLRFTPIGSKKEKRNYGLIFMDYEQFFGQYDGEITDDTGKVHSVTGIFGAFERMKARF